MIKIVRSGFLVFGVLVIGSACSASNEEPSTAVTDTEEVRDSEEATDNTGNSNLPESKYPFPPDISEVGTGSIEMHLPVIFMEPDTLIMQAGFDGYDFDDDKEIFIYVNEVFVEATQGSEILMSSIDLSDWLLEAGHYEVVAVQYEDNDPINGEVVQLSKTEYEIKEGS